jgi:hypothetical protein
VMAILPILIILFMVSWFLTWLIILRPICRRLDRIVVRVANLDHKTVGASLYNLEDFD